MNVSEFEIKKHDDEVRLKEQELELKKLEIKNKSHSLLSSPLSAAFIAGLFTIVGAVLSSVQTYNSMKLETERAENLLIQKFIDMAPNSEISFNNLRFVAEAGLLSDEKAKKLSAYLEEVRSNRAPIPLE